MGIKNEWGFSARLQASHLETVESNRCFRKDRMHHELNPNCPLPKRSIETYLLTVDFYTKIAIFVQNDTILSALFKLLFFFKSLTSCTWAGVRGEGAYPNLIFMDLMY